MLQTKCFTMTLIFGLNSSYAVNPQHNVVTSPSDDVALRVQQGNITVNVLCTWTVCNIVFSFVEHKVVVNDNFPIALNVVQFFWQCCPQELNTQTMFQSMASCMACLRASHFHCESIRSFYWWTVVRCNCWQVSKKTLYLLVKAKARLAVMCQL